MTEPIIKKIYKGKVEIKFFEDSHIYFIRKKVKNDWTDWKRNTGTTTYISIKDKSRPLIIWAVGLMKDFLLNLKEITPEDIETGAIQHTIRKEAAATKGDLAHKWIESYIKAKKGKGEFPEMPEDEDVLIAVNGFMDWIKKHHVSFVDTEKIIYSLKHDYSGKMDIEAIVEGKRCLVDIKTSNSLYNDVRLQTAAYLMADVEESGVKYKGRWAVRLAKETEAEYLKRMKKKGVKEIKPYVAFEAVYLDEEKEFLERDFKAFLACLELFRWNKLTDFWQN